MNELRSHKVVSRDDWLAARKAHLKNEKALTRMRDLVAAERRTLPWVKVEKEYVFVAPEGKKSLAELFGRNSQLIVHHFMFGPDWNAGCPNCSLEADQAEGAIVELDGQRFTALNGGPALRFNEAISFVVNCESQEELDEKGKLSESGEIQQCGWLKDRYGVAWQVVPVALFKVVSDPDRAKAARVMEAIMQMKKLDLRVLERGTGSSCRPMDDACRRVEF